MDPENGAAGGEGAKPQDPQAQPQDPKAGEGSKPHDTGSGEGNTVNRHQYERDIANRDRTIGELKAEVERLKGEGGKAADAMKAVEELKAQLEDERTNSALTAAGCVNAKAAKALLGDYEGDVGKLKEACPYLFGAQAQAFSTGGAPAGAAGGAAPRNIKEALASTRARKG